jgi:uncharacterized phiE125 gp8 family phage protein
MLNLSARPVIVTVAPTVEPVTLAQMKVHCRIESDETLEDDYIEELIVAARTTLEQETGRAFLQQTLRLRLDGAPSHRELLLPRAPLQSVSAIQYVNTASATVTFSGTIDAITEAEPGRIVLREGSDWPTDVAERAGSFWIDFVAGVPTVEALDPRIVHAVRLLTHHWWVNREPVNIGNIVTPLSRAIESLRDQLKVW